MNRKLFKIHSWAGLITGVFLLLVGVSGSILVFNEDLNHWLYADRLTVRIPTASRRHSLDACYERVRTRYPQMNYIGLDEVPQRANQSVAFWMEADGVQYKAYVNPYTGRVIWFGKRYNQVCDWLLLFHYTLLGGKPGELVVALLGIVLLVSVLTGFWIYRKSIVPVLLFRVRVNRKNWRTISSGLHRIVGVWALLFNAMIALTGFWMLRYTFTKEYYEPLANPPTKQAPLPFSIDRTLTIVRQTYPDLVVSSLYVPEKAADDVVVYGSFGGRSFLFGDYGDELTLDGRTGTIKATKFIAQKTVSEKVDSLIFPVHAGMYGHWTIKILYALLGLTPGLLSITGFMLWWRRKRKTGKKRPVGRQQPENKSFVETQHGV
ncbi:PepSY-associated TM helix domain-containing protein [Spirosoma sordidisoli]|uniref:PepSY domain-containing protein n=1 Tax=Spirosoma sordidisoli TaxID=2502893 RepID=A0A4Q2UGX2_9BACT|nr:PepSY-associated TM helix domain-containing protein [Spirosoma sordidisoli]RYC66530.1 PepSY domain-containing protein [Spirosoma sordidisoli]